MEKSSVIELIKLDVLDINSKQDAELLQSLKKNSDFPWEEYGYYQNLIALIAATTKLEKPSETLKSSVVTRLLNYKNNITKIEEVTTLEQKLTEDEKEETLVFEEVSPVIEEAAVNSDVSVIEHQSRISGRNNGKARKDPISFREPNYTNIHLLFEDKQTKILKEREIQSKSNEKKKEIPKKEEIKKVEEEVFAKPVEPEVEKEVQIPDSHTEQPLIRPERRNIKSRKPEEELRSKETHKTLEELEKEFSLSPEPDQKLDTVFPEKKWYQKKAIISFVVVALVAVIIGSVLFLSSSEDTNSNKVKTAGIKTTVSNVQNNRIIEENQIAQENINSATDGKKVESKKEEDQLTKNEPKKPALPEPPKLIDAPITDVVENVGQTNSETNKEVVKELTPVIPPKEEKKIEEESPYFVAVEEMPEPIGGLAAIQSKIVYPEIARRAGVEGKVYIQAFVDETGNVIKAEVVKGIGSGCDEAALDAVLKTKFKPGIQRGKAVKVKITIPIVFKR